MRYLKQSIIIVIVMALAAASANGADRMYFSGLAAENASTGNMDGVLEWGILEGEIPQDIAIFRIYRKTGAGSFAVQGEVPNILLSTSEIRTLFYESGETKARQDIITILQEIDPDVNETNFHTFLFGIMDPVSPDYDPLQRMLLIRMNRSAARAAGRAWIDRSVPAGTYTYMITGILADKSETKPLGIFSLDAGSETILPAPANFEQIRVGKCSDTRKNLDHGKIHLNWSIPDGPETISLRVLTYGYDLYRSKSNLGTINLRAGIPAALEKINPAPIVVSGNAPASGKDAYLAVDDGNVLYEGEGLTPGDTFYYYLVARDIGGNYSDTAGPLKAIVPDTRGPVTPWNVHGQQEMIPTAGDPEPRLTLIWDRINNINYIKNYEHGRIICDSSSTRVCYVPDNETCETATPKCADLDVEQYLVFRFASFQEATDWNSDRDGDFWPDPMEDLNEDGILDPGETDPCDPSSHPAGTPSQPAATIAYTDMTHVRTLGSGKEIQFFRDPVPSPDNKVYWYRVAAQDPSGNISPLSPPARAQLWDRSQPTAAGALRINDCRFRVIRMEEAECYKQYSPPGGDTYVTVSAIDETHAAESVGIYERCQGDKNPIFKLIYRGRLRNSRLDISPQTHLAGYIEQNGCGIRCGMIVVRFYDGNGRVLGESAPIDVSEICETRIGCVILEQYCRYKEVDGGGGLHDPSNPLQVCPILAPGQCARIYQQISGEMTPLQTFCYDTGDPCAEIDIQSIVSMEACLGIRVFSKNHVGSAMYYLPCVTVKSAKPEAPLIEGITPMGSESDPEFEIRWSAQSEGMAAFIIRKTGNQTTSYETVWDAKQDPETGQFVYELPIKSSEIELKWCFEIRAIDSSLQMSDWSGEKCAVWGEKSTSKSLPWPPVPQIPDGGDITAFSLIGEGIGALVLSEDLTNIITEIARKCRGTDEIPICTRQGACLDSFILYCGICARLQSWNQFGRFVVYRQEKNMDLVQVSPLVETIHCENRLLDGVLMSSRVDDPLVSLVRLNTGSVTGVTSSVKAALEGTTRLIFTDWYPHKSGEMHRYQVAVTGAQSKEPEIIYTSDWITLP